MVKLEAGVELVPAGARAPGGWEVPGSVVHIAGQERPVAKVHSRCNLYNRPTYWQLQLQRYLAAMMHACQLHLEVALMLGGRQATNLKGWP